MDKNKFLLGIVVAAVGLFMLLSPDAFIKFTVIILGIGAFVDGLFILVTTKNLILDPSYSRIMSIRGWMSIAAGALAVALPLVVAGIMWTIMAYTLAAYLLISSALEVYAIGKLKRNGIMIKQSVIEVLVSLLLAAVLLFIPSRSVGHIIVYGCGLSILIAGLGFAFVQWKNRPIIVHAETSTSDNDN